MLPYVVLAAEGLVVLAFAVYTAMLLDLDRHARSTPVPHRDAASETLVGGVRVAFVLGLAALVVLSLADFVRDVGLVG